MNFLTTLLNNIIEAFKRVPLAVFVILAIAIAAPSLFGYIFYAIIGLVLLGVIAFGVLAWRMRRVQREVMDQFRQQGEQAGHRHYSYRSSHRRAENENEGDVSVHTTTARREKRISDDVGEYVDFKEEKTNDK